MIINLQGGLGNQLFQYAYGRTESLRNEEELGLNPYGLQFGDPPRRYGLSAYNIRPQLVDDPGIDGYWQSEKYFDRELIYSELARPKGEPNSACRKLALEIDENSCFLGVRRADYLWPERIGFHGVLPLSYYRDAMAHLPTGLEYFVFTDDPAWCADNLLVAEIVDVNGPSEKHWDIWLMSLFPYAVIANSTFHWWGAWLGGAKVIAPKKWFVDQPTEIIPERWTTL